MKCCSIKLVDRMKEYQTPVKDNGRRCHPIILGNDNHSYRSSLSDISKSDRSSENSQPCLSVLNIILPPNIKAFNTGSSTKKWASKRPRLKSAKFRVKSENRIEIDVDSLDISNLINGMQNEYPEEDTIENTCEDLEIDPDIRRLLEETHVKERPTEETEVATTITKRISFELEQKTADNNDEDNKRKSKRRKKKKSKEEDKDKERIKKKHKKKLTKTVSFSLSKPPSPGTEQIIRVDVVSNYDIEFEDPDSNRTDFTYNESTVNRLSTPMKTIGQKNDGKFTFQIFCTTKQEEIKDFKVESKRVTLLDRNGEK